jgi:hypothetical protein
MLIHKSFVESAAASGLFREQTLAHDIAPIIRALKQVTGAMFGNRRMLSWCGSDNVI